MSAEYGTTPIEERRGPAKAPRGFVPLDTTRATFHGPHLEKIAFVQEWMRTRPRARLIELYAEDLTEEERCAADWAAAVSPDASKAAVIITREEMSAALPAIRAV